MATIQNARDVLLQAAATRLETVAGPTNVTTDFANVTGSTRPSNNADVTQAAVNSGVTASSGGITLSSGGAIKGGQTAYDSGNGFFLGYTGSAYKFSVGNSAGNKLTWNGSTLAVVGDISGSNGAFSGTITAANASSISDGASALVLMTAAEAAKRGLKPLAKIVAHATQSQDPSEFTIAPIGAMTNLLKKAGWDKNDVDLFEINEAFAMVTMLAMREHGLDHAKVNVYVNNAFNSASWNHKDPYKLGYDFAPTRLLGAVGREFALEYVFTF